MLNIIKAYLSLEMSAQDFASAVQTNDELVQFINGEFHKHKIRVLNHGSNAL